MKNSSMTTALASLAVLAAAADFNIRNYGARMGETCTAAIRKALDAALRTAVKEALGEKVAAQPFDELVKATLKPK